MQSFTYSKLKSLNSTFILILFFINIGCKDIVEPDLANVNIRIIAPTNNLKTTRFSHTFLWEEVEDATGYNFQIVQPSFNEVQQLIANEELFSNQFEFTLSPGKYEWRIQAFNASSQSPYQTYKITIDSTLVLSGSKVILSNPVADFASNDSNLTFSWLPIGVADNYVFYLRSPDFNGEEIITPTIVNNTSFILPSTLPEGPYEWSVKAGNEFSESDFAIPRKITFDFTPPSQVTLDFPSDGGMLGDSTFRFLWQRPQDGGSPIRDSLKIYNNLDLTGLVRSVELSAQNYSDSLGVGSYYWFVISKDLAGNQSLRSDVFSFTIN